MGVFVGPGRGSASGSVVAYCIGITNIDPIQYGLLFERFLSPDRKTLPDIDTDFDDEGRQKVIEYVVAKYGKNQVAQIITYGTMAAKMSIKDVARVLDLPLAESNALAKLVPERPGIELRRLLHAPMFLSEGEKSLEEKEGLGADDMENVRRLREIAGLGDARSQVLKEAARLEGSVRNTGIHAAGIIIAPQDLTDLIPVAISKDSPLWVTQIDGNLIEKAGVLKMDFLGLKTLSILKTALGMIRDNHGREIDLDLLPLDDRKTFHLYQRGETNATFQFESAGMQKYLRELRPDKLDDLIVMNALYRPGPMAYIPQYIARKHGRELVEYDLADMQGILEETYGITVYQEQVMLLSQRLAGFSKGDADVLRSAMGKKQKLILDKMKKQFIEGAMAKKHPREKLEKIWTDWEAFAQYAFNKSHSACYALLAYQTAYLKANYPSEYMAAVLNHAGSIEKITFFMEECKRMGLKVLGPDCNESQKGFAVNAKGEIRFGLGGLKGVGESAIESIINERSREGAYVDIFDFIRRINQRAVNKKSMESLAFSGAFECFNALHRAQYFHIAAGETASGLDRIIRFGNMYQAHSMTNSHSLFGELALPDIARPKIPVCDSWTLTELLEHEKEITGMFLSGHPLDHYQFEFKHYGITKLSELNEFREAPQIQANPGKVFRLAGLVIDAQHRVSRTGKQFGSLVIEDYSSKTEFMLWSEDYSKYASYLEKGKCLFLTGSFRLRYNRLETEFRIERIMLLESLLPHFTRQLILDLPAESVGERLIQFVEGHCRKHPGRSSLRVNIVEPLTHCRASLLSSDNRFEMNDEMADFLGQNPDWGVQIVAG
jgi:DNA polymerase-3 subunit alpha